jgi:hypothetical protein
MTPEQYKIVQETEITEIHRLGEGPDFAGGGK